MRIGVGAAKRREEPHTWLFGLEIQLSLAVKVLSDIVRGRYHASGVRHRAERHRPGLEPSDLPVNVVSVQIITIFRNRALHT